jgi:hypothetical protein
MQLREGHRQVRRLRLRAPSENLAFRAQNLLADALRTATLPDRAGRLLYVRRLKLGRFDAGISPQSLSLLLENRIAVLEQSAVHALGAGAAAAPAVWFRDRLEAHLVLAQRIAEATALQEWFWPRVVPAIAHASDRKEALRAVLLSLTQSDEAPAALLAFVRSLAASGHIDRLIESLREEDVPLLHAASGIAPIRVDLPSASLAPADGASPAAAESARELRFPPAQRALAARLGLPHSDVRLRWVAAMLPRSTSVEIPYPRGVDLACGAASLKADTAPSAKPNAQEPQILSAHGTTEQDEGTTPAIDSQPATYEEDAPVGIPEVATDTHNIYMPLAQPLWPSGAPTAAGGLAFLLVVLARLGYAQWVEENEHWRGRAIEKRMLRLVCARLELSPEDPAWRLGDVADVEAADTQAEGAAALWLKHCRRWLRREARIGIATLVSRPARLTLTPTHADLVFELKRVDLAIRRQGLDIDPGWLPWYGRVLSFHYEQDV